MDRWMDIISTSAHLCVLLSSKVIAVALMVHIVQLTPLCIYIHMYL